MGAVDDGDHSSAPSLSAEPLDREHGGAERRDVAAEEDARPLRQHHLDGFHDLVGAADRLRERRRPTVAPVRRETSSQRIAIAPYSWVVVTTSSPGPRSSESATAFRAVVVLGTSPRSSGFAWTRAPTSSPHRGQALLEAAGEEEDRLGLELAAQALLLLEHRPRNGAERAVVQEDDVRVEQKEALGTASRPQHRTSSPDEYGRRLLDECRSLAEGVGAQVAERARGGLRARPPARSRRRRPLPGGPAPAPPRARARRLCRRDVVASTLPSPVTTAPTRRERVREPTAAATTSNPGTSSRTRCREPPRKPTSRACPRGVPGRRRRTPPRGGPRAHRSRSSSAATPSGVAPFCGP